MVDATLEALPKMARAKLKAMREEAQDAHALLRPVDDKRLKLYNRRDELEAEVSRLEQAKQRHQLYREEETESGSRRVPDHSAIDNANSEMKEVEADLARVEEQYAKRQEAWQRRGAIVTAIDRYLRGIEGEIRSAPPVAIKPVKSDRLIGEISATRSTIAKLKADRRDVITAPLPLSDAKQMIEAWVSAKANKARPQVYGLLDGRSEINFIGTITAMADLTVVLDAGKVFGKARGGVAYIDPVGVQCWLDPDRVVAALERDLAEIAGDNSKALSAADRQRREAEISADILQAERAEEALVEAALAERLDVHRRPDADPRAILGLADDLPDMRD